MTWLQRLVSAVDQQVFLWQAAGLVPPEKLRRMAKRLGDDMSSPGKVFGPAPYGQALRDHAEEIAVEITTEVCWRDLPEPPGFRFEARLYDWLVSQLRAEATRVADVAADLETIVADQPAQLLLPEDEGDVDRRVLIVQHRASGLRAQFTHGGRYHHEVGTVMAKAYSIPSIDPTRPEERHLWGADWHLYVGHGIGPVMYRRAAEELPHMRWRDTAASFYGHGIRAKLHTEDPWRWQSRQCVCHKAWANLSVVDARRIEHHPEADDR